MSSRSMALSCSLLCVVLACSDAKDTYTLNSRPDRLAAPTGLSATVGSGNVKLAWNPVPGAYGYEIYRSAGAATNPALLIAATGNTAYTDVVGYTNPLAAGTTYYYRLMAKTNTGYDGTPTIIDSVLTEPVTAAMVTVPPQSSRLDAPTVTVTDVDGIWRFITWTEVPNATTYDVYRANTHETFIDQGSSLALFDAIAVNVTGLVVSHIVDAPSTQFAYVVIANKSDQYYLPSAKSTLAFNTPVHRLGVPSITASQGIYTDKILIEWDKIPNAATYRVYRAESRTTTSPDTSTANVVSPFQLVADLTAFSTYQGSTTRIFVEDTANDLSPSTVENNVAVNRYYWYKVQAVGGEAAWADSSLSLAQYGTLKPNGQVPFSSIAVPQNVQTANNGVNAYITVRWDAVLASASQVAAASYDLYRAKDTSTGEYVRIVTSIAGTPVPAVANQLEYQDSVGVEKGANYYYKVVARAPVAGLESDLSAASGAGFVDGVDPFTSFAAVKDGSNELLFTWSQIRNVNRTGAGSAYQVRYISGAAPPADLSTGGAPAVTIPSTTPDVLSAYWAGTFSALPAGPYLFWVVAWANSGEWVASSPITVTR